MKFAMNVKAGATSGCCRHSHENQFGCGTQGSSAKAPNMIAHDDAASKCSTLFECQPNQHQRQN